MARTLPDLTTLEGLVAFVVAPWTAAHKDFTAWDVTREVRAQHPDVEVVHDAVRDVVAAQMTNVPDYALEWRDYAGTQARTYFYEDPAQLQQQAQIPAPAPAQIPAPKAGGLTGHVINWGSKDDDDDDTGTV